MFHLYSIIQFFDFFIGLHSDLSLGSLDNTISSQPSDSGIEDEFRRGMLSSVADDLVRIIMTLDAVHFKSMLDQTRQNCVDQEDDLRRRQDRIMELESKLSGCEVELHGAIEERDRARDDASHSSLAQDDVVIQARADRDTAVARRTKAEVELAKTRVELMQANGQLLESIQQKVELSQQLEQWQVCYLIKIEVKRGVAIINHSYFVFFLSDGHARVN